MTRHRVLPDLEAATYQRHALHAEDALWVEKNCYVDVCIEVLHALGLEPLAAMGFCAAVDFEGDNFTFYKPSHDEIRTLYGLDIQELNVWRPLAEHAEHHLAEGKFLSTEADSYYLPDTSGTDYQRNHVKTTIAIADIDVAAKRLGYFHSASYYELKGEDFDWVLGAVPGEPRVLPLFAELFRTDRVVHRSASDLAAQARAFLARHVERRPVTNPVERFRDRFVRDLPGIQERGLAYYHQWAFATMRQLGSATELLALHLRWLETQGAGDGLGSAADAFYQLSEGTKTLILKAARSVNTRKPLDLRAALDPLIGAWERGMSTLQTAELTAARLA